MCTESLTHLSFPLATADTTHPQCHQAPRGTAAHGATATGHMSILSHCQRQPKEQLSRDSFLCPLSLHTTPEGSRKQELEGKDETLPWLLLPDQPFLMPRLRRGALGTATSGATAGTPLLLPAMGMQLVSSVIRIPGFIPFFSTTFSPLFFFLMFSLYNCSSYFCLFPSHSRGSSCVCLVLPNHQHPLSRVPNFLCQTSTPMLCQVFDSQTQSRQISHYSQS